MWTLSNLRTARAKDSKSRFLHRGDIQMSKRYVNTCSVSRITGDVHIETTVRHPPTPVGGAVGGRAGQNTCPRARGRRRQWPRRRAGWRFPKKPKTEAARDLQLCFWVCVLKTKSASRRDLSTRGALHSYSQPVHRNRLMVIQGQVDKVGVVRTRPQGGRTGQRFRFAGWKPWWLRQWRCTVHWRCTEIVNLSGSPTKNKMKTNKIKEGKVEKIKMIIK